MKSFQTNYRVTYSDTDQMGFMHHSNYLKYCETARWELFRSIGLPYPEIENEGTILPVTSASLKFIKPLLYDEIFLIKTRVIALKGARIIFGFIFLSEAGEIMNEAEVAVACVNKKTGKACIPSIKIKNSLNIFLTQALNDEKN
jgi:acyl-CoA thioester hydrolase